MSDAPACDALASWTLTALGPGTTPGGGGWQTGGLDGEGQTTGQALNARWQCSARQEPARTGTVKRCRVRAARGTDSLRHS